MIHLTQPEQQQKYGGDESCTYTSEDENSAYNERILLYIVSVAPSVKNTLEKVYEFNSHDRVLCIRINIVTIFNHFYISKS